MKSSCRLICTLAVYSKRQRSICCTRQGIGVCGNHLSPDRTLYHTLPGWSVTTTEQREHVCWRAILMQQHQGWLLIFLKHITLYLYKLVPFLLTAPAANGLISSSASTLARSICMWFWVPAKSISRHLAARNMCCSCSK